MKRVLIVFPTGWDVRQLVGARAPWCSGYELVLDQPADADCPWDFDVLAYIDATIEHRRGRIDGVFSSSDYPGATVAGAVATGLGLPGSTPAALIRCAHKYYSRIAQQEAVPEATPAFHLIDAQRPEAGLAEVSYPCFVKPVKGAFSVMSRRISTPEELREFLAAPAVREFTHTYLHLFNRLLERFTPFGIGGGYFLAEEFLRGWQVTVEGFVTGGEVQVLGVVDSIMHPGTGSFARFDYPSALRAEIQARMEDIARRAISAMGLSDTMFNIEMIYEPAGDRIHIIEINPRMCGQFADLYEKVDGVNGYEVALALACGEPPVIRRGGGRCAMATSFALRVFEPVQVVRAPREEDVRAAEALHPGALVWTECVAGQPLADFASAEDGSSARYGVINVGGADREALLAQLEDIRARLDFRFEPL